MSTQERDTLAPGPYVVGGPWHSQEEDENGNRLWMSEIQIVGGHAVVATIYAATENDARSMAERAITAWNTRPVREDAGPEKSDAGTVITPVHTSPGADGRHAPKDQDIQWLLETFMALSHESEHEFACSDEQREEYKKDRTLAEKIISSFRDAHPPRDVEAQWVKDEAVPLLAAIRAQCSTGEFTGADMKHFYEMIGNALRMRAALDASGCAS